MQRRMFWKFYYRITIVVSSSIFKRSSDFWLNLSAACLFRCCCSDLTHFRWDHLDGAEPSRVSPVPPEFVLHWQSKNDVIPGSFLGISLNKTFSGRIWLLIKWFCSFFTSSVPGNLNKEPTALDQRLQYVWWISDLTQLQTVHSVVRERFQHLSSSSVVFNLDYLGLFSVGLGPAVS